MLKIKSNKGLFITINADITKIKQKTGLR